MIFTMLMACGPCNSYNMGKRDLPDIYMPKPGGQGCISGKSQLPMS